MTPRRFDAAVVAAKLQLLRDLLADLDLAGPVDADRLAGDRLLRHAVERILTQLVDVATGVNAHLASSLGTRAPSDYRESFSLVAEMGVIDPALARELHPSMGMRNLLTHEYASIDLSLVAAAVPLAASRYREYVRQVAAYLLRQEPAD